MDFEQRSYVIIPASEVSKIDFSEVLETSAETCRYSVDGTKTFVKYEGEMPPSVASLVSRSDKYTHAEILEILKGSEWTPEDELEL